MTAPIIILMAALGIAIVALILDIAHNIARRKKAREAEQHLRTWYRDAMKRIEEAAETEARRRIEETSSSAKADGKAKADA